MSTLFTRSLAGAAMILACSITHADTYLISMVSTVGSADLQSGLRGVMPVGSAVQMSFTVNSENFVNSQTYPTRGYVIDASSFSLTANGVSIGVSLTAPTYFVLRNNDPVVDGFFLSSNTAMDSDFGATVPGIAQAFNFNYHQTWTGGNQLHSLNIADAVGSLGLQKLSVYQMDLELPNGYVMADFNPPTVTISAVPEPATFGILGLGLAVIGIARRRKA